MWSLKFCLWNLTYNSKGSCSAQYIVKYWYCSASIQASWMWCAPQFYRTIMSSKNTFVVCRSLIFKVEDYMPTCLTLYCQFADGYDMGLTLHLSPIYTKRSPLYSCRVRNPQARSRPHWKGFPRQPDNWDITRITNIDAIIHSLI